VYKLGFPLKAPTQHRNRGYDVSSSRLQIRPADARGPSRAKGRICRLKNKVCVGGKLWELLKLCERVPRNDIRSINGGQAP
jgi:hypothetical protein